MQLAHQVHGPVDGVPVVLIHGITESRHSWGPLREELSTRYRVLAVDLRGHGESPDGDAYDPISYATDVHETAATNGFDRPVVIGHSLGGFVASAMAATGPVRAIVNVDQPLRLAAFKDGLMQLRPMLTGTPEEFAAAIAIVFGAGEGPLSDADRSRIRAYGRPSQPVVLGTWQSVFESTVDELDATVAALAAGITVPYLALHGTDPGPEYGDWLRGLVPTASVEVWPDHGHYPHLVDRPRFLARVDAFIASLPLLGDPAA